MKITTSMYIMIAELVVIIGVFLYFNYREQRIDEQHKKEVYEYTQINSKLVREKLVVEKTLSDTQIENKDLRKEVDKLNGDYKTVLHQKQIIEARLRDILLNSDIQSDYVLLYKKDLIKVAFNYNIDMVEDKPTLSITNPMIKEMNLDIYGEIAIKENQKTGTYYAYFAVKSPDEDVDRFLKIREVDTKIAIRGTELKYFLGVNLYNADGFKSNVILGYKYSSFRVFKKPVSIMGFVQFGGEYFINGIGTGLMF